MGISIWKVAPLLFGSGLCALIYQIALMREFRLVFGTSTAASAAVVAIFIGGLGLGGWILGKRADRHKSPMWLYAHLEIGIALSAALTPGLLWLVRAAYVALGGSVSLGMGLATVFRLVFASLVCIVPTFLMGGTLPAAARAVSADEDKGRRGVGLLYGVNTLGAVTGAAAANFLLLEVMGNRKTLWMACLLCLLVGMIARHFARRVAVKKEMPTTTMPKTPEIIEKWRTPVWFVLLAAATVGFVFFLMELVWYRMLGPLLGGTIFTFGLILSVALLGIGLGGAAYAAASRNRPATLVGLATTCMLEAACIALSFAVGDGVAVFTLSLSSVGSLGFAGHAFAWTVIACLVVLPAAFVAGYQFPLLIGLLGHGREQVGRHVGLTYAWNTVGAILGSLAGGFGLMPLLTAPGCWQLGAYLLVALGLAALVLSVIMGKFKSRLLPPLGVAVVVVCMLTSTGPTAAWRHNPIGAGRVDPKTVSSQSEIRKWERHSRRTILWEEEGVESSVAVRIDDGLAFILNGKSDGNARQDAATMVMLGLLGAILHPDVKHAMVIGLGTGTTAGWLGALPGIDRVDCVELEPAILEVARQCAPVNQDVMNNPKVHMIIGDGREVLLTTPRRYDLIVSEPSNPYRAGIASLFTREYYQSVADRLAKGGIFIQWLQTYEIDARTVRTVYATLASVFPAVETWETQQGDLLLIASRQPIFYDAARLRARLQEEPFHQGVTAVWRVIDLEGFLAHFLARSSLARTIHEQESHWINTDDHNHVEFGFARTLGRTTGFSKEKLLATARARGEDHPEVQGEVDWERVKEERNAIFVLRGGPKQWARHKPGTEAQQNRLAALIQYRMGNFAESLARWKAQDREPTNPTELALVAGSQAALGDQEAPVTIEKLRAFQPTEAEIVKARLQLTQGKIAEAASTLERALIQLRKDPWPARIMVLRALELAQALAKRDATLAKGLIRALEEPFSVYTLDDRRLFTMLELGNLVEDDASCTRLLGHFEPHFPWRPAALATRKKCYERTGHPLAAQAARDLEEYLAEQPIRFDAGLVPSPAGN